MQIAWPIIVSNGICLALSAFILTMKLMPRPQKEKIAKKLEPVVGSEHAQASARQLR